MINTTLILLAHDGPRHDGRVDLIRQYQRAFLPRTVGRPRQGSSRFKGRAERNH